MSSTKTVATRKLLKNPAFWLVLLVILGTVLLMLLTNIDRLSFIYLTVPPLQIHHWLSWTGASFVAIFAPAYYLLKRRYPKRYHTLLRLHVFGNLLAFMMISIHFAEHIREYLEIIPHPGTGLPLYTAMVFLVATGIMQRFQLVRGWMRGLRFIHVSITITFYLIVVFHVLHGTGIF